MSEKDKSTLNNTLLSVIAIMISIIGYFYIKEVSNQNQIDTRQSKNIEKLLEVTKLQNDRIIRLESKVGIY